MITDYVIESIDNPAFEDNISLMLENITSDGGVGPTIVDNNQAPMKGTKANAGKFALHFRLNQFLDSTALLDFLEQGMTNPKPAIKVLSIRSAAKVVKVDSGETDPETGEPIYTYEYRVEVVATKTKMLKYMGDVQDGEDAEGNPIMRPPNASDDLYLSGYIGTEPIELM
jgi:hypothetical protein